MTIFVFPDIETTGLKVGYDKVLEIAWRITNGSFADVGIPPRTYLVEHSPEGWADVWNLLGQDTFVREMHEKSGLYQDLRSKAAYPLSLIRQALQNDIEVALAADRSDQAHLAGLSVGFDRSFLQAEPEFEDLFDGLIHHRILDLSSLKLMYGSLRWQVPETINLLPHRAFSDVDEAISLARNMRDELKYSDFVEVEI